MDAQTTLGRTAAARGAVAGAGARPRRATTASPRPASSAATRRSTRTASWRLRDGVEARLIDPERGALVPVADIAGRGSRSATSARLLEDPGPRRPAPRRHRRTRADQPGAGPGQSASRRCAGSRGSCGATGAADVDALRRMQAVLAPRGPDGDGLWTRGGAGLAHRRLAIIDLSERGAQPMTDATADDRLQRDHLQPPRAARRARGARARVRLGVGHRGDPQGLPRVGRGGASTGCSGMFAFCIVEPVGRAFLARDRLGVKPLYLADVGGALRFASTLPALLAGGGVDTSLDPVALHHYLSFHSVVPAPRTILAGVRKLPPATHPDRRARRLAPRAPLLAGGLHARPGPGGLERGGLARRGARGAAHRGAAAHGVRRPRRRAAVRRAGLLADRRAAGRVRPARAGDVLGRLRRRRRARGQRVPLLAPGGRALRHRPPDVRGRRGAHAAGARRRDRAR